ncbi:MAG: SIMPL domain-containing protein [Betaproteobacteria bacterium]|nr:SIMPL domain-containing protein [Betaproteobacteria bacterium]
MLRHHSSISFHRALALLVLLLPLSAWPAQGTGSPAACAERRATQIELSGEASVMAANDLAQATVFAEAVGSTPGGAAAKEVNKKIEAALALAKKYPKVAVRSGGVSTYREYGSKISAKSWRIRSQLFLETRDVEALSALVGELQETLGVDDLRLRPAAETRIKAENEATLKAMAAFRERATLMAGAMGKSFRIVYMSLNGQPSMVAIERNMPVARMAMSALESPMPVEAGESQIRVTIGGTIELLD